jgi:hypothetical protein
MRLSAALGADCITPPVLNGPPRLLRDPRLSLRATRQPSRYRTGVDSKTRIFILYHDMCRSYPRLRRAPEHILAPLASGLCRILQANFGDLPFHALG